MQEQKILNSRRGMKKKVFKGSVNPGDITGISIDDKSQEMIEM